MTISNELLDELLKGGKRPEDLPDEAGLMKELKIRLIIDNFERLAIKWAPKPRKPKAALKRL